LFKSDSETSKQIAPPKKAHYYVQAVIQ